MNMILLMSSSVPLINSGSVPSEFGKGGLHRFSESTVDIRKKVCICFAHANTHCLAKKRGRSKKTGFKGIYEVFDSSSCFHGRMLCKKPACIFVHGRIQRLPICRWAPLCQQPQQQVALGSGSSFTGERMVPAGSSIVVL